MRGKREASVFLSLSQGGGGAGNPSPSASVHRFLLQSAVNAKAYGPVDLGHGCSRPADGVDTGDGHFSYGRRLCVVSKPWRLGPPSGLCWSRAVHMSCGRRSRGRADQPAHGPPGGATVGGDHPLSVVADADYRWFAPSIRRMTLSWSITYPPPRQASDTDSKHWLTASPQISIRPAIPVSRTTQSPILRPAQATR